MTDSLRELPMLCQSPFAGQEELRNYLREQFQQSGISLEDIEKWIVRPPRFTTLRYNPAVLSCDEALNCVRNMVFNSSRTCGLLEVECHPIIQDMIIAKTLKTGETLTPTGKEVILDLDCSHAVLRGAEIYAAGVLGAPKSLQVGDEVSIYADVQGKCLRGWAKYYDGKKIFLGNGLAKMNRKTLFGPSSVNGIAVELTNTFYPCPSLYGSHNRNFFPQNFPSAVCIYVLDPQPGEKVLDMCAAPGGKTTHIASRMKNEGVLVALEISDQRLKKLIQNLQSWNLDKFVQSFKYDAIKCCRGSSSKLESFEPPFSKETFDKILIDAPCSGLGQRPQLRRVITAKSIQRHAAHQKMFLRTAVKLLKVSGELVYSTCSFSLAENEEVVAHTLSQFPCLELVPQNPHVGKDGLKGSHDLSDEQLKMLQRFLTTEDVSVVERDTIAFFIAKFRKKTEFTSDFY